MFGTVLQTPFSFFNFNLINFNLILSLQVTCNLFQLSLPILSVPTGQSTFSNEEMMTHLNHLCSTRTLPNSVSSGWMSTALGFIGALMAFLPSSWRSLTAENKKKKINQKECNKCKAGVYVGVGDGVHNNRHLVDPFQNRTTVYGMKNCSHSGK